MFGKGLKAIVRSLNVDGLTSRIGKLYDALEAGKFKSGELAPRIRTLMQKKEELQRVKANIEERLRHEVLDTVDLHMVQPYTSDLRNLLAKSAITEQRSFLRSFVEKYRSR